MARPTGTTAVALRCAPRAEESRSRLVSMLGDLHVWADPVRFEQVLFNLLDNALKDGAEPIEVAARPGGDQAEGGQAEGVTPSSSESGTTSPVSRS